MKRISTILLFALGVFFPYFLKAQQCGFDQVHQKRLQTDPVYNQQVQELNNKIVAKSQSNPLGLVVNTPNGLVYEIPVVVHVLHPGAPLGSVYNPPDNQIIDMIDYLNKTYEASWPGYPAPGAGGTFIPLRFALAKRDPNCNPTTGIIRVDASSNATYAADGVSNNYPTEPGAQDAVVKAISRWPNDQYYNIWIVHKINGVDGLTPGAPYVAGYAYFPGASANVDGTIMLASVSVAGGETLPHEIGHAFALYHTFEGDNNGTTCPPNSNCANTGDYICDTDPHIRSPFNCPSGNVNPCTGNLLGNVVHNMMDYSNCNDRFTPMQGERVINALLTARGSLISSLGATPITGAVTTACVPTGNSATLSGSNSGPRNITISDANNVYMAVTSSGYSGDGNQYYIDNTCKHMAVLTSGQIYEFKVSTGLQPEKVHVYIDYNNDGDFQANEEIYSHTGTLNFEEHTFQFAVPNATTIPGLVSCVPLRMRVVSDRASVSSVSACGQLSYGQAEDYSVMILAGGPAGGTVSVNLTTGTNPSCFNAPLTFTAVPSVGITNPTFEWFVNNISTGVTTNTYSSSTLDDGDIVNVQMQYISACGTNETTMSADYVVIRQATAPPAVAIALTSGSNPGCAGQTLEFTATPQNGGSAPTYEWYINNVPQGINSAIFTSTFNNNDVVHVEMVSNSSCAVPPTATSNQIIIQQTTINADVFIQIFSGTNPSCAGAPISFEAVPTNGGSTPQYQWLVNNAPVSGATNDIYTTTSLQDGDEVKVILYSSDLCVINPEDTSAGIIVNTLPSQNPFVFAGITNGNNPGCLDSMIEFSAIVFNHGTNPQLTWLLNNTPVATGLSYASNVFQNGDVVTFRSVATDGACYTSDTMYATPISLNLFATPQSVVISLIGNMLVANPTGTNIQWYGPSGLIPGANSDTYHPTEPGLYYARVNNNGCLSKASNFLMVSLLDIQEHSLSHIRIHPNPTTGLVHFDWGRQLSSASFEVYNTLGQQIKQIDIHQASHATIDLSDASNGMYFVIVRENGNFAGTVRIVVAK